MVNPVLTGWSRAPCRGVTEVPGICPVTVLNVLWCCHGVVLYFMSLPWPFFFNILALFRISASEYTHSAAKGWDFDTVEYN